ncbi:hypothetical protein LXL04_015211 [Taraxacum kok-saghyz]
MDISISCSTKLIEKFLKLDIFQKIELRNGGQFENCSRGFASKLVLDWNWFDPDSKSFNKYLSPSLFGHLFSYNCIIMTNKKRKSYKDAHHESNYHTCYARNNFAPLLQTSTTHLHCRMDNVGSNIVSSDYIDIGDNNFFCNYCHATFWYDERVKYLCTNNNLKYNNCCKGGKVVLPNEPEPPDSIQHLFKDKHFLDNIRAYNQMFSMTSFGAQIDESVNDVKSPYVFKISGQIYHWLGSLCPSEGNPPRFLQLYIYDTQNEVENRMRFFGRIESKSLNSTIVQQLIDFLDKHNDLVKLFRTARSICEETNVPDFHIRLYSVVGSRQYDLPTSNAIGAIVFGDSATFETDYDVVITPKDGIPQRVNKLHQSYMSLQFPLLFLYGQPGYHPNMKLTSPRSYTSNNRQRLSMNMYYAYQLHDRLNIYNSVLKAGRLYDRLNIYSSILQAGRLFQQYVVTAYCSIELDRIDYVRENQKDIRNDYLSGLYDAISRGDQDGSDVGSRIILPASFTGGPRYMYSHYLDALAICCVHGNPQFFITFTCNVKWPEIKRFMANYPELTSTDRADIVVRVFEIKVRQLLQLLRDQKPFGVVTAAIQFHLLSVVYTIEFQKRGLPHCHILLWIKMDNKISDAEDIDKYISAELPNPTTDPDGYRVVSEMMVHGPCGLANPSAPCTDNGTCKKRFPKSYNNATFFDKHGYVHYKRRNTGIYTKKGEVSLDNSYVVPYNRMLCLTFHAHINVEYCGWNMLIKYLFKYISKGTDRIVAHITKPTGDMSVSDNRSGIKLDEIQRFIDARYICPHEACWRIFNFDIHGRDPAVQILSVHLENMQQITYRAKQPLYSIVNDPATKKTTLTEWLQFNLHHSEGHHLTYQDFPSEFVWYSDKKIWKPRGCKSYEDIRTIDDTVFPTYRAACEALGLLGDDNEWTTCLNEASLSSTSAELRSLFAHILIFCDVSNPVRLWNTHWKQMADDIPKKMTTDFHIHDVHICDTDLRDYALYELEFILNSCSKSTKDFGLPTPPPHLLQHLQNRIIMEEKNYDRDALAIERDSTAHSRFKIPLDLSDESICNIKKGTHLAKLFDQTDLIIWDEAPMNNRLCFETLDRTLRDILDAHHIPFGGKSIMLGGDFRQTLPVIQGASKSEIINASIVQSPLWRHFKLYTLTTNMRLLQPEVGDYEKNTIHNFSSWLLDIGNGNLGQLEQTDNKDISWVRIPEQYCIPDTDNGLSTLVRFIYDEKTLEKPTAIELQQKVIVCPKNETADLINDYVLSMHSGDITTYISSDEAIPLQNDQGAVEMLMASTFLADLKPKDRNKVIEVKIYRTWIVRFPPNPTPKLFCCMLLDKAGNAIQATMSINDIEYFKPIVEVNKAYKISNFFCEETKSKQHTLPYPTTLRFGRATTFHPIPLDGFPSHHFNFVSYNQLYSSLEKSSILIDQLQLCATQATHYYLNPDIEEVNHSLPKYKAMFAANPPLQVVKQKYPDHEKEKTRNRYSLSQLIAQNPLSYKSVRFTCEGSIVSLSTSDNWYQYTCKKCKKKLMSDTPPFECRDDGLQPEPEISYCFRAIVADDTTTAPFVFFSLNADVVPNIKCSKLVKEQGYSNPKEIPPALEAIKGERHIFQFHFNQSSKKGIVEFVFDAFLDSPKPDTGKRPTFEDLDNTNEMDIKRQKSIPIIDE